MSLIHIKRVTKNHPISNEMVEKFLLPAVAISTPQGKKLIPNPAGQEACIFDTLEEAEHAARMGGFDYQFEGKTTHMMEAPMKSASGHTPRALRDVIPLLIERLQDKEGSVVANAALALGEIAAEDAIVPLCQILGHEDNVIRKSVAGALANIGMPAIPHLQDEWEMARKDTSKQAPYVRLTIMMTYVAMGEQQQGLPISVLPITSEGLEDESWLVRAQAALAIAHLAGLHQH